jgi:glycosyltransferase involved in cell wall biosynthesis
MKLLHVVASLDPRQGGVCQAVRTMIAGLAAQGVTNEVATLDAPDADWQAGVTDPFPAHALGPGRSAWGYSAQLIPWLTDNLGRFDKVILHGLWQYPGYALRRAGQRLHAQRPAAAPAVFVMPHGMLDPYFQKAEGRRIKALRNQLYWQLIEKAVVNDAAGLLFTCETERQLAHEPFPAYRPRQERIVSLGVAQPPVYTPAMRQAFLEKCPAVADKPYLLFLSRIHEKKGVDLLLQAYSQLAAASPATVPALVVAGPGLDTPYGQQMQQAAAGVPTVFFPGMLSGDAKWGAFYGCDAFVLPSHQENFGIAVAEALACGKPVLISDQVNICQEIAAGQGGLVAPDTLAGTQQLLNTWVNLAPADQQGLGQHARQVYLDSFAVASATTKLLAALS